MRKTGKKVRVWKKGEGLTIDIQYPLIGKQMYDKCKLYATQSKLSERLTLLHYYYYYYYYCYYHYCYYGFICEKTL